MIEQFEHDVAAVQRLADIPTILDTVCRLTGMGFAAVARVTPDHWVACSVDDRINFGLTAGGELKIETTICHEIRMSRAPVIIDDVDADPVYRSHHTPLMYGFKSYISVPIILPNGKMFGTLCAIDPNPKRVSRTEVANAIKLFADLIGTLLAAGDSVALAESNLSDEKATSRLREQFIAVLGHDLRNPIASLQAGTGMLQKEPQSEKGNRVLSMMRESLDRIEALVENVLDFARGRLGGGISLDRRPTNVHTLLSQAVGEIRSANPRRALEFDCTVDLTVNLDPTRLYQLITNLLGNAIVHGAVDEPIRVTCSDTGGIFCLSVANGGAEIPLTSRARLFEPFERNADGNRDGLGLGLYIASQIAEAHDGVLSVASNADATTFTLKMPID